MPTGLGSLQIEIIEVLSGPGAANLTARMLAQEIFSKRRRARSEPPLAEPKRHEVGAVRRALLALLARGRVRESKVVIGRPHAHPREFVWTLVDDVQSEVAKEAREADQATRRRQRHRKLKVVG